MDEQEKREQIEKLRQIRKEGAKGCLTLVVFFFIFISVLMAVTGGCQPIIDSILGRNVKLKAHVEHKDLVVFVTNLDSDSWKDVKITFNSQYYTNFDEIKPGERVSLLCWSRDLNGMIKFFKPEYIQIEAKYKDKNGHYYESLVPRY